MRENSIRLRLTKSEVETFCNEGKYECITPFPNKDLTYILCSSSDIENLQAEFIDDIIQVNMPTTFVNEWGKSDKVGFTNNAILQNGTSLLIKVEKDFVCLDETEEDQSDNYPNPRG